MEIILLTPNSITTTNATSAVKWNSARMAVGPEETKTGSPLCTAGDNDSILEMATTTTTIKETMDLRSLGHTLVIASAAGLGFVEIPSTTTLES